MIILLRLALALAPLVLQSPALEPRPQAFWQAIVEREMALPEGASALELIVDLSQHLGAADPVLRDEYAYGIPANWIHRQQLLEDDELRALAELWLPNLTVKVGEPEDAGDETVLLRSFSALNLSLLAAHDLQHPFLESAGFDALLDGALSYLERERDLRGWVAGLGWCHSAAHTADLLKFLARSPHLHPEGQFRILSGVAHRMRDTGGYVFVHSEDERLAAAVVSIMARTDFDTAAFDEFVEGLGAATRLAAAPEFDPVAFAAQQNSKNLARALYVHLARFDGLTPELEAARARVLAVLTGR